MKPADKQHRTDTPYTRATRLFFVLLPEVEAHDRERRMSAELSADAIRAASDADLAARLRLKRRK